MPIFLPDPAPRDPSEPIGTEGARGPSIHGSTPEKDRQRDGVGKIRTPAGRFLASLWNSRS